MGDLTSLFLKHNSSAQKIAHVTAALVEKDIEIIQSDGPEVRGELFWTKFSRPFLTAVIGKKAFEKLDACLHVSAIWKTMRETRIVWI